MTTVQELKLKTPAELAVKLAISYRKLEVCIMADNQVVH